VSNLLTSTAFQDRREEQGQDRHSVCECGYRLADADPGRHSEHYDKKRSDINKWLGRLPEGIPIYATLWRNQGRIAFVCSHVDGGIWRAKEFRQTDQPGHPLMAVPGARLV